MKDYSNNLGDIDITSEFSGITTESSAVVDFKSDGSYLSQGAYTIAFTSEGFTQSFPVEVSSGTGDWYVEGDRMILSEGFVKMSTGQELISEPGEMIIDELTANKMVLSFSNETTLNQNGYESIVNVSGYYIFTK